MVAEVSVYNLHSLEQCLKAGRQKISSNKQIVWARQWLSWPFREGGFSWGQRAERAECSGHQTALAAFIVFCE